MKKIILLLLFIPLVFSCSDVNDDDGVSLTIVNKDAITLSVIEVAFVGYEYKNLNISSGESKTFSQLSIPSGSSNVNVDLKFRCSIGNQIFSKNISKDFSQSTTITISDPEPNDTTPMNCVPFNLE